MPVDYSMVDKVPEDKNHYVALCNPKDNASDPTSIQQFVMMPVVPDYDLTTPLAKKLSQANLTLPTSVPQPSCVSQSTPSSIYQTSPGCKPPFVPKSSSGTPNSKVKKGKLYLMNYLPKKRKFTEHSDEEGAQICNEQPKKRPNNLVEIDRVIFDTNMQ